MLAPFGMGVTALIRRAARLIAIGLVLAAGPVHATAIEERFDLEVVVRHPDHGEVRRAEKIASLPQDVCDIARAEV